MANNNQQMPSADEISITDKDTKDANARKKYATGWYCFRSFDANNKVSETKGSLMKVVKLAALKDPDDPKSVEKTTVLNYVVLPLRNPKFKGHKVPKTAGMVASYFRGMEIEFNNGDTLPDYPRLNEAREMVYEGTEISREEAKEKSDEVTRMVQDLSLEVWADSSKVINRTAYGYLSYQDGSDFPGINKWSPTLPEDAELVAPENFFEEAEPEDDSEDEVVEEEEVKPAPKAVKATPAKKAPAAKKKK